MIKKIKIQNIQSHKKTELEFSPGINAIVGSSNNGKSAVLRALYWVCYNRPLGTDVLLSHWATDKKGNQIAPMSVTVENENGIVIRRRTKDENQYIVNNEELNVVKTDVPSEVVQILQLSDTNIQRQQDAPFLLSCTSGQVAQYFNKIVRLDIIDRVLSNAESKRRKTVQEITQNDELCEQYKQHKEKYSWLDDVEKLIVKYDNISNKNNSITEEFNSLNNEIEKFNAIMQIKEKFNVVKESKNIISEIEELDDIVLQLDSEIDVLENLICNYEVLNKKIYPNFNQQKNLIDKFNNLNSCDLDLEINYLNEKISCYEHSENKIKNYKLQVKDLKKQLPKICPLCGAIMNEGVCENE